MTFLSFFPTIILAVGLYYFQNGRYDKEKVIAPFGWPRIYFKDVKEMKIFANDVIIKTEKRSLGINIQSADKTSLKKFIKTLEQQTEFKTNCNFFESNSLTN